MITHAGPHNTSTLGSNADALQVRVQVHEQQQHNTCSTYTRKPLANPGPTSRFEVVASHPYLFEINKLASGSTGRIQACLHQRCSILILWQICHSNFHPVLAHVVESECTSGAPQKTNDRSLTLIAQPPDEPDKGLATRHLLSSIQSGRQHVRASYFRPSRNTFFFFLMAYAQYTP
jgi:hypothetical protein